MGLEAPPTMDTRTVHSLCNRLSSSSEVEQNLPWSLRSKAEGATHAEKRAHLQGLLERDAALFLEKYGGSLSCEELSQFEVLKGDYEVNWHLNRLSGDLSPSPQQEKARAAQVKNRRLAYMQRLEDEGSFFSEDAMRERAPLLHEQFLGRQPTGSEPGGRPPVVPRPGEGLAELVLRQAKEDHIAARLKRERADFEKEAAEESAAATARQIEDPGELDEEPSAKEPPRTEVPPQDMPQEPTDLPALPTPRADNMPQEPTDSPRLPLPRAETGGTMRAASGRKGPRVRFGVISGASVTGRTDVTSAKTGTAATQMDATSAGTGATSARPAGSSAGEGLMEGAGNGVDLRKSATLASAANEIGENLFEGAKGENKAGPFLFGGVTGGPLENPFFGNSVEGTDLELHTANRRSSDAAGLSVNGRNVTGGTSVNPTNGRSVNPTGRSVNPAGGRRVIPTGENESEEKVSHARFGEFTTPEPVSASRIASQVVRRVLESATAGHRHPVTRFAEIPESGSGEGSNPAGVSGRHNLGGRFGRTGIVGLSGDSGLAGVSGQHSSQLDGRSSEGVHAGLAGPCIGDGKNVIRDAGEGIRDGIRRIGDGGEGIGDGTRRIGDGGEGIRDGTRGISDGVVEEMDTDEEDLGSRTHTDASELGGDLVEVDSPPKGQIAEFRRVMKERFLEGNEEEHVDYGAIDGDTKLDDDWLGEVDRDAQEKYFDED